MKKIIKWIIILFVLVIILGAAGFGFYTFMISPIGIDKEVTVVIPENSTGTTIASILEEKGLIRDRTIFKLYLKINKTSDLKHGTYRFNKKMSIKEMVELLIKGSTSNDNDIKVLFKEGLNVRQIATVIEKNTSNTKEDVYSTLRDIKYLDYLIGKYWFLTDDIKNPNLYYSLEGYLFPDTYYFKESYTVKDIVEKMLDTMALKLVPFKKALQNGAYSVHEYITLASVVELEGVSATDRKDIAGVFYNRLKKGMALGSDVTTYYAAKLDKYERDLYVSEINSNSPYNTRNDATAGKLPVGPIASPSISSIDAVLYPNQNNYFYFVADINGKVYFAKTYEDHLKLIKQIKASGLWIF